jgi:hypothetical protein
MFDDRTRAILSDSAALQQARACLFQQLDLLAETCDLTTFCDTLADVAKSHAANASRSEQQRLQWGRVADTLDALFLELSCATPNGNTCPQIAPENMPY